MFSVVSAASCPHLNKPDHASATAPTAASVSHGCPQCATALALSDGAGPLCSEKDGGQDGAVEETDGEGAASARKEKGEKGQEGGGKRGGCCRKPCMDIWYDTRMKLWEIVESKYFNRGIMIAILINTISMGIEHHEQVGPPSPPPSGACSDVKKQSSLQFSMYFAAPKISSATSNSLYFQHAAR